MARVGTCGAARAPHVSPLPNAQPMASQWPANPSQWPSPGGVPCRWCGGGPGSSPGGPSGPARPSRPGASPGQEGSLRRAASPGQEGSPRRAASPGQEAPDARCIRPCRAPSAKLLGSLLRHRQAPHHCATAPLRRCAERSRHGHVAGPRPPGMPGSALGRQALATRAGSLPSLRLLPLYAELTSLTSSLEGDSRAPLRIALLPSSAPRLALLFRFR